MTEQPSAGRVTRDVGPEAVPDLLERPPRAAVAFLDGEQVDVLPAKARTLDGVHLFAVRGRDDLGGREVALVRDDGPWWFELRAVTVRGVARPAAPAAGEDGTGLAWYAVEPRRVIAWDYGSLREAGDRDG
jgi:hypothetical protein